MRWLGFEIGLVAGERLWFRTTPQAIRTLEDDHLALAHERPNSSMVANQKINGWLRQLGPCYEDEDREPLDNRQADDSDEQ